MLCIAALFAPLCSFAQYFNKSYDVDMDGDEGTTITLNIDGTYSLWTLSIEPSANTSFIGYLKIAANGSAVLLKHTPVFNRFTFTGSTSYSENIIKIDENNYYGGITQTAYSPRMNDSYISSGLIKYNGQGDTTFYRVYTDTNIYQEITWGCLKIPGNKYWVGGGRAVGPHAGLKGSAFLRNIDSNGKELWCRIYNRLPGTYQFINSLYLLSDGRILAGGSGQYDARKKLTTNPNPLDYYAYTPWFALMDTAGNVLKDTVYGAYTKLVGGGFIKPDRNGGGYFHWGTLDSFFTADPNDAVNLPHYIAHLDSNFRVTWRRTFADTAIDWYIDNVKQLSNGDYLLMGRQWALGWMARYNKNGTRLWSNYYKVPYNTDMDGRLSDAIELPNKRIVATGSILSDKGIPKEGFNVWIISVDSNGCEFPNCKPTEVPNVPNAGGAISVYPNPTTGAFTIQSGSPGRGVLYNLQGLKVVQYDVKEGRNDIALPSGLASGIYILRFTDSASGSTYNTRFVFHP